MDEYLKGLEGISELDWNKLKLGMDRYFHFKHVELQKDMKLHDMNLVQSFIQSQFGCE